MHRSVLVGLLVLLAGAAALGMNTNTIRKPQEKTPPLFQKPIVVESKPVQPEPPKNTEQQSEQVAVIQPNPETQPEPTPKKPAPSCPTPKQSPETDHTFSPLGPDFAIERTYIPERLVPVTTIPTGGRFICLEPSTLVALESMYDAGAKDGVTLSLISGFRSYATQEWLIENRGSTRSGSLYPSIAQPGHSEHQLGTTVDFTSGTNPSLTFDLFAQSPEYAWLTEHAWEYGFVQSYPLGSEPVTGYIAEPWHFRYVGKDIAQKIRETKTLTLYEYLKNAGNPFVNIGG